VITGSTRLKAGTAQKMVLNMLSTATMVKLGYVTGNRMTSVLPRNSKLRARAIRIIMAESGLNEETSRAAFEGAGADTRVALVMIKTGRSLEEAKAAIDASGGVIEQAIKTLKGNT
jgi:N-acetylmuramic acid 6-phosphate etherase